MGDHERPDGEGKGRDRQGRAGNETVLGVQGSPGHAAGRGPAGTGRGFRRTVTTVDTAFTEAEASKDAHIYLLNFASYKEPGGMFLQGSMAQEESLCHASVLYPVLSSPCVMGMFYQKHGNRLNRGLYHSGLLYSPDVLFFRDRKGRRFDVITCAAPNKKAAQRYRHVTDQEAEQAMQHRIGSLL